MPLTVAKIKPFICDNYGGEPCFWKLSVRGRRNDGNIVRLFHKQGCKRHPKSMHIAAISDSTDNRLIGFQKWPERPPAVVLYGGEDPQEM